MSERGDQLQAQIDALKKELDEVKGRKGADPDELKAIRADIQRLEKTIANLPVVDVREAKQILAAEESETPEYVCPKCNYGLEGNEDKCPGCGEPITWAD